MAEDTVDEVMRLLGRKGRCRTRRLRLVGGERDRPVSDADLLARHGSEAHLVVADDLPADLGFAPLVPGLAYRAAEAVYAVRSEMALTLDDVLTRRTRARLFDRDATLAAAPGVAALIAPHLGWDGAETAHQVARFRDLCAAEAAAGMVSAAELAATVPPSTTTASEPGS
jgi:glycerol-3-phosphate dehydrogenase